MHQRGDWLVPTNNGFPRVQKPPLVYWTMLVSTALFGRAKFALRLPQRAGDGPAGSSLRISSCVAWAANDTAWLRRWYWLRCWGFGSSRISSNPSRTSPALSSFSLWCLIEARLFAEPRAERHSGAQFRSRAFSRRSYVVPAFLDFSGSGDDEQGASWSALWPLGVVGTDGDFCSENWRIWLRPVVSPCAGSWFFFC